MTTELELVLDSIPRSETGGLSLLEAVRFRIGDTDEQLTDRQLTDRQIEYELELASDDVLLAAWRCAMRLVAKYSVRVTKKVGDLSINYSDLASQYRSLASDLWEEHMMSGIVIPAVGQIAETYPASFETSDVGGSAWGD